MESELKDPDDIERDRISAAENEAKRFLARVTAWRAAQKRDSGPYPRESGALKRASMDLTRALVDVRRSRYS